MPSSCVLSGLVFIALAFVASVVSLIAPYWYVETPGIRNTGLWALCYNGDCQWFFQNDFQWEKQQDDWWYAVQGLFILGVLSLLFAFFLACCQLCCGCCGKGGLSMVHIITGLLLLAFLELATAIALFGAKSAMTREVGLRINEDKRYFSWAFWVGVGGAGLSLLAICFYMIEACRASSHRGYTRGEVV